MCLGRRLSFAKQGRYRSIHSNRLAAAPPSAPAPAPAPAPAAAAAAEALLHVGRNCVGGRIAKKRKTRVNERKNETAGYQTKETGIERAKKETENETRRKNTGSLFH